MEFMFLRNLFFMDIKGPFVFTMEQDLLAQRIIKKIPLETIPITDGEWGSQKGVVRMVEIHVCSENRILPNYGGCLNT